MTTAEAGNENKDPKVPADPGANSPVAPQAPTAAELAAQLEETDKTLTLANEEIVRLKRDKKQGGGSSADDDRIASLEATVASLTTELADLKKNGATRQETNALEERILAVKKKNSEYAAALVSKDTTGAGTGQGSNQDTAKPPETKPTETDGERALRERMENRRISEGRDPKTGLKLK
jgi:hypothetical protein